MRSGDPCERENKHWEDTDSQGQKARVRREKEEIQ